MNDTYKVVGLETCAYCGREREKLHMDHVVPRSRGGPDNASNIVMACQPCNSAKSDMLATEWLGEHCPKAIRLIEQKVNSRLEKKIKGRRDWKKRFVTKKTLYVCHLKEPIGVDFMGEVLEEKDTVFRTELCDSMMAVGGGMWQLSGLIRDLPKDRCRIFNDRRTCHEYMMDSNRLALGAKW